VPVALATEYSGWNEGMERARSTERITILPDEGRSTIGRAQCGRIGAAPRVDRAAMAGLVTEVRYGPLELDVEPGRFRPLTATEVARLKSATSPKRGGPQPRRRDTKEVR